MTQFATVREKSLEEWQRLTGRVCGEFRDDISSAFECEWQDKNEEHVSIFCSLGVWADCLSQLLQDERYDEIDITDSWDSEFLYPYYNQLLLITSEILDDLVGMYSTATGKSDKKKIRKVLSFGQGYDLHELFAFINTIVKHKTSNLHVCNHHLPILFEDQSGVRRSRRKISIANIGELDNANMLLMPSLVKIVITIAHAYKVLDRTFRSKPATYRRIVEIYKENE